MQTTIPTPAPALTPPRLSAPLRAMQNLAANQSALRAHHAALLAEMKAIPDGMEWIYGRDGSLTARDAAGQWWGGCSLPRRASMQILSAMDVQGRVACFLLPAHAAQLRVALDLLRPDQAIITLCPDLTTLGVILHCEDFAADLAANRLWLAAGENWTQQLEQLFNHNPGLPVPSQFIRSIAVDTAPADALIGPAQEVFASATPRRTAQITAQRDTWKAREPSSLESEPARLCVLAPSHFRLWEDVGHSLGRAISGDESHPHTFLFDSDNPISASPTALSARLGEFDAIVAPHGGRGELGAVIPESMPWITWVVAPHIPVVETAGPRDGLLLADPSWISLATGAGWTRDRLEIATWPAQRLQSTDPATSSADAAFIAIVADLPAMEPPARVKDFSSHLLLWEAIRSELLADPFSLGKDPISFLMARQRRMRIADQGFEPAQLIDALVVPTFIEGLALQLMTAGIRIRCSGAGWNCESGLPESAMSGPVTSRETLNTILSKAAAVVYPWPTNYLRALDAMGCRLIRPTDGRDAFVRSARTPQPGTVSVNSVTVPPVSRARVNNLLRRLLVRSC